MNLLTTKLALPPLRQSTVSRPRLYARLDAGLATEPRRIDQGSESEYRFARRLTLLSAPAGFGKSTLVRAWIERFRAHGRHTAGLQADLTWFTLDSADNDAIRFWTYLLAALQTVAPDMGSDARSFLQPADLMPGAQAPHTETFLTVLINDLAAYNGCLLLVLDDYHLIVDGDIHRGLTFLLDHLPPQLHLVLATRADPPLPLSKWRGRNEAVELRAVDLAFTAKETTEFLVAQTGLSLSPQEIAGLAVKTEGWIAGLQMAALALQARTSLQGDANEFVADLGRTPRYLLDYLADEVLAQQPEPVRRFLMQTAVLDRLCDPLCEALTASDDTVEDDTPPPTVKLRDLARANLFISPLEETSTWYRYHPLFAQVLLRRLGEQTPCLVPELHRRAALWYEEAGLIPDAIRHALRSAAQDHAAQLIETQIEATLMSSENRTVLNWIDALPDEQVSASATLCVTHAWALLLNGQSPEIVLQRLEEAEVAAGHRAQPPAIRGSISALRAALAVFRGRLPESVSLAQEALANLTPEDTFMRSVALNTLGIAQISLSEHPAAAATLQQAVDLAQRSGNTLMAVAALCNLAGVHMLHGRLHSARDAYRQALDMSTAANGRRLPVATRALLGLGELAREWNDLDAAESRLSEAGHLSEQYGEMGSLICDLTLSRVKLAQDNIPAAEALLARARKRAAASRATQLDDRLVSMTQARSAILIAQRTLAGPLSPGHLPPAANAWLQERESDVQQAVATASEPSARHQDYNMAEAAAVVLARIYLARGDAAAALSLVEQLAKVARHHGRERRLIELLVLGAIAHRQAGQKTAALTALQEALKLAVPEGYVRSFVDEGPPIRALLEQLQVVKLQVTSSTKAYVAELMVQFDADPLATTHAQPETSNRQLPLSPRELEVLQLIAEGCTNREVGQKLVITLNTVKGHTREIYSKLGVNSRTQAVAKARASGLLPQS